MKLFIVLPLYVFLALLVEGLREKVRGLRVVRLGQVSPKKNYERFKYQIHLKGFSSHFSFSW